jgi:hypothetical protein
MVGPAEIACKGMCLCVNIRQSQKKEFKGGQIHGK